MEIENALTTVFHVTEVSPQGYVHPVATVTSSTSALRILRQRLAHFGQCIGKPLEVPQGPTELDEWGGVTVQCLGFSFYIHADVS